MLQDYPSKNEQKIRFHGELWNNVTELCSTYIDLSTHTHTHSSYTEIMYSFKWPLADR